MTASDNHMSRCELQEREEHVGAEGFSAGPTWAVLGVEPDFSELRGLRGV